MDKRKHVTRDIATGDKSPALFRDLTLDKRSIDEKARTVEIAFSSETPIRRWGEDEILDHSDSAVRLERARSDGPLLVDHNWSDQIGTIDEIRIDADRVGRAVVRFGNSERASEIFQDVVDNIRKSISVGYRIHKYIREVNEEEDTVDIFRVIDWEVLEISFVSVPADVNVGVGRSELTTDDAEEIEVKRKQPKTEAPKMTPEEKAAIEKAEREKREAAAEAQRIELKNMREREAERQQSIRNIAAMHPGHEDLVSDALRTEMSTGEFTEKLTEAVLETRKNDKPDTHLDLSEGDVNRYSVCRALLAQATGNWADAGYEREVSDTIAERIGKEAQGVFVPYDVQEGKRVVTTTGPGAGALGTDHLDGSFIDNLRDQSILMSLGARVLAGLRGNISIPRKTGNATFGWVAEDADGTLSDVSIGTLAMSPKTLAGAVAMSRLALQQLTPDMDSLVMSDMAQGAALAIDIAGINGPTGGDNPVGIMNTTGVLTNTIAVPGQPTWPEVVNFETLAAAANALAGGSSYITTAAVRGFMKTAKKDAGSGIFLIEGNESNGYPVNVKTDAGFVANSILFGDFTQLIVGMWGVLDMVADTSTKVASGGLVIRMFQDMDFGVRQPTAFVKNA